MNIALLNSRAAAPIPSVIRDWDEEEGETTAEIQAEAMESDPVAQRTLGYRAGRQPSLATVTHAYELGFPGTLFNARA